MSVKQKRNFVSMLVIAIMFGITPAVNAMHIMEGYLPPKYCIAWGSIRFSFFERGIC